MKDSEFIQLLNLYLDHEISAADAARLEAEVQGNPARRRVYQDYCRMQKACKLLASEFESQPAADDGKVVAFDALSAQPGRRTGAMRWYTVGSVAAAAACVAFVFVGQSRRGGEGVEAGQPAIAQVAPAVPAAPVVAPAQPASRSGGLQRGSAMLVADTLFLTEPTATQTTLTSAPAENDQFKWISALQISPLQQQKLVADQLRFEASPASLRPEARQLGRSPTAMPGHPPQEHVILQFQR